MRTIKNTHPFAIMIPLQKTLLFMALLAVTSFPGHSQEYQRESLGRFRTVFPPHPLHHRKHRHRGPQGRQAFQPRELHLYHRAAAELDALRRLCPQCLRGRSPRGDGGEHQPIQRIGARRREGAEPRFPGRSYTPLGSAPAGSAGIVALLQHHSLRCSRERSP